MERDERATWHYRQACHIDALASEMARLYVPDFHQPQTQEYLAIVALYRQAQADKVQHDKFDPPQYIHFTEQG